MKKNLKSQLSQGYESVNMPQILRMSRQQSNKGIKEVISYIQILLLEQDDS